MRLVSLTPLLLVALLGSTASADTTFYSGRTEYILVTTPKTWDQAEADAVAKGGHLARIDSSSENALILSKVTGKVSTTAPDGGGTVYVWIGGKETATEGSYQWADGTAFWSGGKTGAAVASLYTNWGRTTQGASGPEPDNFAGTQNRAAMAMGRWPSSASTDAAAIGVAGMWNDINGTNALPYVIERPITKPSEGIFATFTMTHGGRTMGSFTCQLFYDKSPVTVAYFMGLAEGSRPFFDENTGAVVSRPYFNGLKLHRIIPGFMIQGGDQRGTGTGGPGFQFADEFDPQLRHDHLGVLSMANSGANSNGSQFFVTVSEPSSLNDVHNIFGHVVSGYETVVVPLSNVPTTGTTGSPADRPLEDVVVQGVTIERLGAAALAFNPSAHNTSPVFSLHPSRLEKAAAGKLFLRWSEPPNVSYALSNSPDLKTWKGSLFSYIAGNTSLATQELEVTNVPAADAPNHFFKLHKATYSLLPPASPLKKRLILKGGRLNLTITMEYATATGGTHLVTQAPSFSLTSTLSNSVWETTRWDTATVKTDINPPVEAGTDVLTHSDWTFTFRSVNGAYTGGSFSGGLYTQDRSIYYAENGTFTVENIP